MERTDSTDTWVTFDVQYDSSFILDVVERTLADPTFPPALATVLIPLRDFLHGQITMASDSGFAALMECRSRCTPGWELNTLDALISIFATPAPSTSIAAPVATAAAAAAVVSGTIPFAAGLGRKVILTQKNLHPPAPPPTGSTSLHVHFRNRRRDE
jgi:hypothetical protein